MTEFSLPGTGGGSSFLTSLRQPRQTHRSSARHSDCERRRERTALAIPGLDCAYFFLTVEADAESGAAAETPEPDSSSLPGFTCK